MYGISLKSPNSYRSKQLTVAVSYQCIAIASMVQPVQLPKNCCSHWTPPPFVTAGPTSFALPANGWILAFQSAAAVVGSMLDCPPLSGSLKLVYINQQMKYLGDRRSTYPSKCLAPAAMAALAASDQPLTLVPQLYREDINLCSTTVFTTHLQHRSEFYAWVQVAIWAVSPVICPI